MVIDLLCKDLYTHFLLWSKFVSGALKEKYSLQRLLIWFLLFGNEYISLIVGAWLIFWFLGKYKNWEIWDCSKGRARWEEFWTQNCSIQHNVHLCVSLLGKFVFGYFPQYKSERISYSISNCLAKKWTCLKQTITNS